MQKYIHKVNYYETDKMGITHHSNYIRWMEEARIYFLESIGFGYDKLESDGIISPVIGINCEYKDTTTFNDEIAIDVLIKEFKGVRLIIEYKMENIKTGKLVLKGFSEHCFLDNDRKPVRLSKEFPEFNQKLKELANKSVKKVEN
jgi:acyl-CoA thioester hydrolase